jgi:hypothetical protein
MSKNSQILHLKKIAKKKFPYFFVGKRTNFFGEKEKKQNCTQGKLTCYP